MCIRCTSILGLLLLFRVFWYTQNCHQYNSGAIVGKEPRYIATRMKEYFDQRFERLSDPKTWHICLGSYKHNADACPIFRFSACCRSLTLSVRNARHLVDYDIVPIVKSASALKRPNAKKTKRPRENVVSPVRMLKVNKKPKKESSSASLAPPRKIAKVSKPSKHTSHIKTVKPKASSNATRKVRFGQEDGSWGRWESMHTTRIFVGCVRRHPLPQQ